MLNLHCITCIRNPNFRPKKLKVLSHKQGKYKRIFLIGSNCVTTYNPSTMEITNQFQYSEIINIAPVVPKVSHSDATLISGGSELFTLSFMTRKRKSGTR